VNKSDPGLRRCRHCGAFDAWTGKIRREDWFGVTIIAHECGVCHNWWRVPITRPITAVDVHREGPL
jgi:hypothetical protein